MSAPHSVQDQQPRGLSVTGLVALLGRVALGLIIFGLGLYLARLAARAVRSSGLANAPTLALVAQGAVLALAFGLGGRKVARDQLREWTQDNRSDGSEQPPVG